MERHTSYACSFTGRRKNNEDSYCIEEISTEVHLFAVADGMGGSNAGEVASQTAIKSICAYLKEHIQEQPKVTCEQLKELLKESYRKAHDTIASTIKENDAYVGMGSTLTILLFYKEHYLWANLGDSRLYLIQGKESEQLTKDHTVLQEYLDRENASPDEAWSSKYANYLTKALDGSSNEPDIYPKDNWKDIPENACFVLCSDGMIPDKGGSKEISMAEIIAGSTNIKEASEQLVSSAYYEGSSDNITVVLVETGKIDRSLTRKKKLPFPPVEITDGKKGKHLPKWFLPLLIALILLLIFLFYQILKRDVVPVVMSSPQDSTRVYYQPVLSRTSAKPFSKANKWSAFDKSDYSLPVNKSSLLSWNPYTGSVPVTYYMITIRSGESEIIDSLMVPPSINAVPFSKIKTLTTAGEYNAFIKAVLKDGSKINGNEITFIFQ